MGQIFLNSKFQPLKVHEDIVVFSKSASSYSKKGNMKYFPQIGDGKPYHTRSGNRNFDNNRSNIRSKIVKVETDNNGSRMPRSVIRFAKDKEKLHPTQKPVELLEYLIKTYTNEGETVLDNCMGSGSTGVACVNTNRKFIGMELREDYYGIAEQRIKRANSGSSNYVN